MPKANRVRVDYMPCKAALEAQQAAQEMYPKANSGIDRPHGDYRAVCAGAWQMAIA